MVLDEILEHKRKEVAEQRRRKRLEEVQAEARDAAPARDFRAALANRSDVALIAEIKQSSPSAGVIRQDFDPRTIADCYHAAGAAAISVLTDAHFFGGKQEHLAQAKAAVPLPALQKDFVIDEYQVYQARAAGADAVLLIVRILPDEHLRSYLELALELGMAALVETHNGEETERAVQNEADIIGINNRDLDTLTINLGTTANLVGDIPPGRLLVSESGISSRRDIERLAASGIHAVLVGESLLRSENIVPAARSLTGVPRLSNP